MLIVVLSRPLVAAAQEASPGPLVRLARDRCHVDQLNDPDESTSRPWAHRTG